MSFTDTWTESYPAGSTSANELDTAITQGVKRALRERLAIDHYFLSSESGDSKIGYHKKITLYNGTVVSAGVADHGIIHSEDVSSKAELFYMDEDSNDVQITSGGYLNGAALNFSNTAFATALINKIYPVGSIYITITSTNPGTTFGVGTWTAFGAGKVLVGLDSGDTDFDTAEETGGSKTHTLTTSELPSHNHTIRAGYGGSSATPTVWGQSDGESDGIYSSETGNAGSGSAHNNLQPYIVVYMWKRTA